MSKIRWIPGIVGIGLWGISIITATPLVTDRPDFTESSSLVPIGYRAQAEFGITYAKENRESTHTFGEVLFRIPVTQNIEFRVGLPSFQKGSGETGLTDASVGVKMGIREADHAWPEMAVILATSVPLGDTQGEHHLQPLIKVCLGWDLSEKLSLSSNFNASMVGLDEDRCLQFSESISLGYSLDDKWGLYGEAYCIHPAEKNGGDAHILSGGITYLVSNDIQLDIRAGKNINSLSGDFFAGSGMSVRF